MVKKILKNKLFCFYSYGEINLCYLDGIYLAQILVWYSKNSLISSTIDAARNPNIQADFHVCGRKGSQMARQSTHPPCWCSSQIFKPLLCINPPLSHQKKTTRPFAFFFSTTSLPSCIHVPSWGTELVGNYAVPTNIHTDHWTKEKNGGRKDRFLHCTWPQLASACTVTKLEPLVGQQCEYTCAKGASCLAHSLSQLTSWSVQTFLKKKTTTAVAFWLCKCTPSDKHWPRPS